MSTRDTVRHIKTSALGSRIYIGAGIMVIVIAVAVLMFGFYALSLDELAGKPIVVPLSLFAINAFFAGLIFIALMGIRRERRLLALMRAEDPRIECSPSGLAFTSRSQSHAYDWAGFRAVHSDSDYLPLGPLLRLNQTSLLLLDGRTPKRPPLRLRLALGKAIRRATFFPVTVDGITVIPMKYFDCHNIRRLVEQLAEWHRRAVG